ncbi:MAG: DUF1893 domain-containing protein [Firmicutes bacterium]|nr:DUF1893 domain-containing protein [Bacillota bacterium]
MNNWFEVKELPCSVYAICEPNHEQNVKSFLVLGSEKALLFDTGMGLYNIKDVVDQLWQGELMVVSSHFHFDHIGDNWRFPFVYAVEDPYADFVATKGLAGPLLEEQTRQGFEIKPYNREFIKEGFVFDLGNRRLKVLETPGHSDDCIMLYDMDNKVLFCGDMFYTGALYLHMNDPIFGKSSLEKYYLSISKVLETCSDMEYVYCSHNSVMVNPQKLVELNVALEAVRCGIAQGNVLADGQHNYSREEESLIQYPFHEFSIIMLEKDTTPYGRTKKALFDGEYTCTIAKDDQFYTTKHRGVKPLLDWLDAGIDLEGAVAADKVVGKAAAYLYVLLKVGFVYASVISKPALEVFERYGIEVEYDTLVDAIENRTKTGFCPMETAVWDVNEPDSVPGLLKETLKKLMG